MRRPDPHRHLARARLFIAIASVATLIAGGTGRAQPARDLTREVTAASNRLGYELYRRLGDTPGNVVMSPYSVSAAMAMALLGAQGETEREMTAALQVPSGAAELAGAYRKLAAELNGQDPDNGATVTIANALHLTRLGHLVRPDFRQAVADQYGAPTFEGSDLAAVNDWVKQRTNGRIEKILTKLDPYSVCVLLNAIYFKATWAEGFDRRATKPADFHLASGEIVQVPTMHQQGFFRVLRAHSYDAVRLPYRKSSLGMIIVVPQRAGGLGEIEAGLDTQFVSNVIKGIARTPQQKTDLSLPSYRIEWGTDLIPPLRDLGIKLAFDRNRADFSGITGSRREEDRIHISQVQHRAFIDVNEEGTEAAGASAVEFAARASPVQPTTLKIDRPFLFLVADEQSGAILFIGRVADPRQPQPK